MGTKQPLGSMPESNAAINGGTAGSTGGASTADLKRGYTDAGESIPSEDPYLTSPYFGEEKGGFLDRPRGWER